MPKMRLMAAALIVIATLFVISTRRASMVMSTIGEDRRRPLMDLPRYLPRYRTTEKAAEINALNSKPIVQLRKKATKVRNKATKDLSHAKEPETNVPLITDQNFEGSEEKPSAKQLDADKEKPSSKQVNEELMRGEELDGRGEADDKSEPSDFIGSPKDTDVSWDGCECDLKSIDCLDAIACLPSNPEEEVHAGVVTRDVIKKLATFRDQPLVDIGQDATIGMATQSATVSVWREWLAKNEIPAGLVNETGSFVNETGYTYCRENNLAGWNCFIHAFHSSEEYGEIEQDAIKRYEGNQEDDEQSVKEKLKSLRNDPFEAEPMDYLLGLSQLSRVTFNLRSHVHEIYQRHLKTVDNNLLATGNILRVALHVRRGDACRHERSGYEEEMSLLSSDGQVASKRVCYETGVYMDSLKRVVQMVPDKHVVVYLATDYALSLLDEIKNNVNYEHVYRNVTWKYLDYSRDIFDYAGGNQEKDIFIGSPRNNYKAILGEAAVADIWHLSHGQVFIGHLGSRFGKVSWFQATGRNNAFVPFFSVDGHSICCEIDEACGAMRPYVASMENCLAIFWPTSKYISNLNKEDYRKKGSTVRIDAANDERLYRSKRVGGSHQEDSIEPPHDFVGSPNSTMIEVEDCKCDLVSIDCLDAIRCNLKNSMREIHAGVVTRSIARRVATHWNDPLEFALYDSPIGMASQYVTTTVWKEWLSKNQIPKGLTSESDVFVNETLYPYCRKNGLEGKACFLNDFVDVEYDDIEKEAIDKYQNTLADVESAATRWLQSLQSNPFNSTALDYLVAYAHISRITFNPRSHVRAIYKKHLRTIDNRNGKSTDSLFQVSMHFRRGDSCEHEVTGYAKGASLLHSPAQVSGDRLCYETSVYMDALKRVIELAPDRHVVVYLATDHSGSLMDEIRTEFPELYKSVSWKYVEYPRHVFDYFGDKKDRQSDFIESPDNKNKAILGETAVADIWHLSHGRVFIGHLGSRFGKLAWWQSTARYNSFIPFYTVDGHSVCCDIDEACGEMAEYVVSMENCLAVFWPTSRYRANEVPEIYWASGAYFRKEAAKDERIFRRGKGTTDVVHSNYADT